MRKQTYSDLKPYLLDKYCLRVQQMKDHLGNRCVVCGSSEALQIDHIDPTTKSFDPTKKWGAPWKVILSELSKCQLLCKEHHLAKTIQENSQNSPHNKNVITHGKQYAAYVIKCGCDICLHYKFQRNIARRKK